MSAVASKGIAVKIVEVAADRYDSTVEVGPFALKGPVNRPAALTFESPSDYDKIFTSREDLVGVVGLLVWEASKWPASWVSAASKYLDLAVLPSQFCSETLIDSGFTASTTCIVPHGFNATIYNPNPNYGSTREFRILHVGTPARRKGLDLLLRAIPIAFKPHDEVTLTIKGNKYSDIKSRPYLLQDWTESVGDLLRAGYHVNVVSEVLTEQQMKRLYYTHDVICQPFRGEGFCLPLLEAAACGLPYIATQHGGPLEFLTESFGWFVQPRRAVPASAMLPCFEAGLEAAEMVEVDVEELACCLKKAADDHSGRMSRSEAATVEVAHLTWDLVADSLLTVLASHV